MIVSALRPRVHIHECIVQEVSERPGTACKIFINNIELATFSGLVMSEAVPRTYEVGSNHATVLRIHVSAEGIPYASTELSLWQALESQGEKPKDWPIKSHSESSQPTLRLNISRVTTNLHTIESLRQQPLTACPTLNGLVKILQNLYRLSKLNRSAYEAGHYYLGSLHAFLVEDRKRQIDELKGAIDNDGRAVDVKRLRGNILHDTMFLIESQLVSLEECFAADVVNEPSVKDKIRAIGAESLEIISRVAAVACHYADVYFQATYNTIKAICRVHCEYLIKCHEMLLQQRTLLLYARDGVQSSPGTIIELTSDLVNRAISEVRDPKALSDWLKLSYTAVLFCFRHDHAQLACSTILSRHRWAPSPAARDAVRRLLTHMVREADIMPECMKISRKEVQRMSEIRKDKSVDDKLGRGSYGVVYEGRYSSKREAAYQLEPVAIKELQIEASAEDDEEQSLRKRMQLFLEIVNCWTLRHKNIVELIGVHLSGPKTSLVFPLMKRGSMIDCFHRLAGPGSDYKDEIVRMSNKWIGDVATGLAYLHTEGVIHGDLRGPNVLIAPDFTAKIADFGLSLFANGHSKNYKSKREGNSAWLAPELFNAENRGESARATVQSDVYSFALVCVEAYTGRPPFHDVDSKSPNFSIQLEGGLRPPRPTEPRRERHSDAKSLMRDELWDLVKQCWNGDKSMRPSAKWVHAQLAKMGFTSIKCVALRAASPAVGTEKSEAL